jgi:SAM-dependent methyltransferase
MPSAELYLRVREKEGRLFPDEIVRQLPELPAQHRLRAEWQARAVSVRRLIRYVSRLPRPVHALELGCGNGWLSHGLSGLPGVSVWGLDLYSSELKQAARLFTGKNAGFLAADIYCAPFATALFDLIVVASAIQYFPDLAKLIRCLQALLGPHGELHILDSPLYEKSEVAAARERTRAYYDALGFPDMAASYFHHTFDEVREFSPRWLRRTDSIAARVSRLVGLPDSPFPWLTIQSSSTMPK